MLKDEIKNKILNIQNDLKNIKTKRIWIKIKIQNKFYI
jgi:hypothetical protein